MIGSVSRYAVALAAALSLTATPAFADRGWGGRHHHRDDVSVGDVLTGVLIIGGIAAIASAATKSSRDRQDRQDTYRYPAPEPRAPSGGYAVPQTSPSGPSWSGSGIDRAVDACVNDVQRSERRVDSVDSVGRSGDGWVVRGHDTGGQDFSCTVAGDGTIRGSGSGDSATYDGTGPDDRPEYPG